MHNFNSNFTSYFYGVLLVSGGWSKGGMVGGVGRQTGESIYSGFWVFIGAYGLGMGWNATQMQSKSPYILTRLPWSCSSAVYLCLSVPVSFSFLFYFL